MKKMILTLCLNPTIQKTLSFAHVARGAVNRALSHRVDASGKGVNVSRVLAQLGQEVLHITQLGGRNRAWFTDMLLEDGIPLRCVPSSSEIRMCYTVLEENPLCTTELVEEGDVVSKATEDAVRQAFLDAIEEEPAAVIISGSKAKGFSDELFPELAKATVQKGILCVADYRGLDLKNTLKACASLAQNNLIIKPNLEEFCQTFLPSSPSELTEGALQDELTKLHKKYGCLSIITNSTKPTLSYDGKEFYTTKTTPISEGSFAINTIGCGDAFTAGFVAALVNGLSFEQSLAEGSRCGMLNAICVRPGSIQ